MRSLQPGQRLLLAQPIIRTARWGAPWTSLIRDRAGQWSRILNRDRRLERLATVPRFAGRPVPKGIRVVIFRRVHRPVRPR